MRKNAITYLEHRSKILENNPVGDPALRTFPVYLPPDYNEKNTYPVFYYLSGWGGVGASLINERAPFSKSIPDLLDELITNDPIHACIVVFPDCSVKYGSSQFINCESLGWYMDYLCDEIVPFIQKEFPVSASPSLRGVLGHSSGGFGAMVTGMLRPEVFGHILSSAGDSHYAHLYPQMIPDFIKMYEKFGSIEKMVDTFLAKQIPMKECSRDMGHSLMLLNMCQCFLPNQQGILGADLFFDLYTGELLPKQWDAFVKWDPVNMVEKHTEAIKKLDQFSLFAGSLDEYGIHLGHRQISKKLEKAKINHTFVEYEAKHTGIYYKTIDHIKHMIKQMPIDRA